jgi:hypothetical protein
VPRHELMERIKALTSQLGRAENPEVIATVAAQLQGAIAEYVSETEQPVATLDMPPLPLASRAA